MSIYHSSKALFLDYILNLKIKLIEFNSKMNARKKINAIIKINKTPKLTPQEANSAKTYFKSRGYKLNNTLWHRYYKDINGEFHENYIPDDIFRPIISLRFNQKKQWPALLDKNLTYIMFSDFKQPKRVIQNINGFYYLKDRIVTKAIAIEACNVLGKSFVIKPTLDSGGGKMVETFTVRDNVTSIRNLKISELFELYKKDFIVQEFVEQNESIKTLNPSSLNTLRIITYLREDGVHVLSSVMRIGKPNSVTDNFSGGGIICGIKDNGALKKYGHTKKKELLKKTYSNVILDNFIVPNYKGVIEMIKAMHPVVPYFKFISWDIGINKNNEPLLIEYNTYNQSIELHQITNGPLFGKFTEEILALGFNRTMS